MKIDMNKILSSAKNGLFKALQSIKKLIINNSYDTYLIVLGILTYISYTNDWHMFLLPIFILIGIYVVYKRMSFMYLIPTAFYLQMSSGTIGFASPITLTYIGIYVLLVIVDIIYNRKIKIIGILFDPLLILVVLSIFTIVNTPSLEIWAGGVYYIGAAFFAYIYFSNATDSDKGNLMKLAKMFLYTSVLVTFQIFHVIRISEMDIYTIIKHRQIHLGWENINIVIYANLFAIILATKLMIESKYKAYYMLLTLLSIVGVLLTLSRSSIGTVVVYLLFMIPHIIIKSEKKVNLLINSFIFGIFILIGILALESQGIATGYFDALFGRDLMAYESRYELIVIAWEQFKSHFIIGSGGLYSSRYYLSEFGAKNYHNTIAQISTLGSLGIITFIWLFYEKTKMILKKESSWKWIVLILLYVTTFVNGWVQPMYFHVTYMLYLFLILATFENIENDTVYLEKKK